LPLDLNKNRFTAPPIRAFVSLRDGDADAEKAFLTATPCDSKGQINVDKIQWLSLWRAYLTAGHCVKINVLDSFTQHLQRPLSFCVET